MSLSSGSPGWILFWTPSSPAMSIAAKAMYPLQDGAGVRNSSRFAFGEAEYMGIRTAADRFRLEYARFTGASNPGTSLLYEFIVGVGKGEVGGDGVRDPPAL